ncbi:unnamed protein product, partial [Scytosiphon promiscuus]
TGVIRRRSRTTAFRESTLRETGRTTTRRRCHRTGGFPAFAATPFGAV